MKKQRQHQSHGNTQNTSGGVDDTHKTQPRSRGKGKSKSYNQQQSRYASRPRSVEKRFWRQ